MISNGWVRSIVGTVSGAVAAGGVTVLMSGCSQAVAQEESCRSRCDRVHQAELHACDRDHPAHQYEERCRNWDCSHCQDEGCRGGCEGDRPGCEAAAASVRRANTECHERVDRGAIDCANGCNTPPSPPQPRPAQCDISGLDVGIDSRECSRCTEHSCNCRQDGVVDPHGQRNWRCHPR